jgi:hypothetical protein
LELVWRLVLGGKPKALTRSLGTRRAYPETNLWAWKSAAKKYALGKVNKGLRRPLPDERTASHFASQQEAALLLTGDEKMPRKKGNLIFIIIGAANVLVFVSFWIAIVFLLNLKYPSYYTPLNQEYVHLLLVVFLALPSMLLFLRKSVVSVIYAIVSVLLSITSLVTMLLIPPLCSSTENPKNYLKIDAQQREFIQRASDFFPVEIPAEATEISYSYFKYSNFLDDEISIEASWNLPEAEYERIKSDIKGSGRIKGEGANSYRLSREKDFLQELIEYEDSQKRISYIMTYKEE